MTAELPIGAADFIKETEELKAHVQQFILSPRQWATYTRSHNWWTRRLLPSNRRRIPYGPGVYTLILQPSIAGHPHCSYLMYVGRTKSLRIRFGKYLRSERGPLGRPKEVYFLNKYDEYVWFCYARHQMRLIKVVEGRLISAYLPPLNDEVEGIIGKARRAFV